MKGYKIVCGSDNIWPPISESGCPVHKDLKCCAVCPDNEKCEYNCGIHGKNYGSDDPRIYCEFFAIIIEEDK